VDSAFGDQFSGQLSQGLVRGPDERERRVGVESTGEDLVQPARVEQERVQ
jgi:hypothetical protein